MDTAARILGNHAYFFRDGDAFTVPEAGIAARTSLPGDEDDNWIDLGIISELSIDRKMEEREVWAPNPGAIELHDVIETKRVMGYKFTADELSFFAIEALFGTVPLTSTTEDYTPLSGGTLKGWLWIEQYDQENDRMQAIHAYVHLKVAGEVTCGDQIATVGFEACQLISSLNAGRLDL